MSPDEKGQDYSIKFVLPVKGEKEHIWADNLTYGNGVFKGHLANDSIYDPSIRVGNPVEIKREDVEDWIIYGPGNKLEGGFSLNVVVGK